MYLFSSTRNDPCIAKLREEFPKLRIISDSESWFPLSPTGEEIFSHEVVYRNNARGFDLAHAEGMDICVPVAITQYAPETIRDSFLQTCEALLSKGEPFEWFYRRPQLGPQLFDADTKLPEIFNTRIENPYTMQSGTIDGICARDGSHKVLMEWGHFPEMNSKAFVDLPLEFTLEELRNKRDFTRYYVDLSPASRERFHSVGEVAGYTRKFARLSAASEPLVGFGKKIAELHRPSFISAAVIKAIHTNPDVDDTTVWKHISSTDTNEKMVSMAEMLVSKSEFVEAEALLTAAVLLYPYHLRALQDLGALFYAAGDPVSSILFFENALAYNPFHPVARDALSQIATQKEGLRSRANLASTRPALATILPIGEIDKKVIGTCNTLEEYSFSECIFVKMINDERIHKSVHSFISERPHFRYRNALFRDTSFEEYCLWAAYGAGAEIVLPLAPGDSLKGEFLSSIVQFFANAPDLGGLVISSGVDGQDANGQIPADIPFRLAFRRNLFDDVATPSSLEPDEIQYVEPIPSSIAACSSSQVKLVHDGALVEQLHRFSRSIYKRIRSHGRP